MPTIVEVIQAASGSGDDAIAAIQMLETHRRGVARSFLNSTESDEALLRRAGEVVALAQATFPWDPVAEDYELAQAINDRWSRGPAPPPNVIMAAMALAPAHHFPAPPRLALVPAWLRTLYARYLLGRAPIFLQSGEADRYAAHGLMAMAALHAAIFDDQLPDAAELANAVCTADSTMIYFNALPLKPYFRDKARISEWALLEQGMRLTSAFRPRKAGKRRIGILHRTLSPGTETFHLLAHIEGRDKAASHVTIYVLDEAPNAPMDALGPWVDAIVQLPADVSAAVERLRADDLDLCFMTNNLGWGLTRETMIAAHRLARVQVISGACPATPGFSSSDLFLSSAANDPATDAQDDYTERLVFLPGAVAHFGYGHDADPATLTCTRTELGVPDDHVFFFSAANYYKITPEVLRAWAEIMARTPASSLGLMPFNPNWGSNYPLALFMRRLGRQLALSGVAPSRVRLIGRVPTRADLLTIMGLADIYLDSFPYSGACSLVDPLLVGLPIVEQAGSKLRTGQGGGLLRAEGLDDAVCADIEAYIERAVRLACDSGYREEASAGARAASVPQPACLRTKAFARDFDRFCAQAVAAAAVHAASLRVMDEPSLRALVIETARIALADSSPALRRLVGAEIVGALPDLAGAPVIDIVALAVELGSASPPVVLATFGPGQTPASVNSALAAAAAARYAGLLFAYRNVGGPGGAPRSELARLAADATGLDATAGGTILFYRPTETALLVSLIEALEAGMPAPLRPAFSGLTEVKAGAPPPAASRRSSDRAPAAASG